MRFRQAFWSALKKLVMWTAIGLLSAVTLLFLVALCRLLHQTNPWIIPTTLIVSLCIVISAMIAGLYAAITHLRGMRSNKLQRDTRIVSGTKTMRESQHKSDHSGRSGNVGGLRAGFSPLGGEQA